MAQPGEGDHVPPPQASPGMNSLDGVLVWCVERVFAFQTPRRLLPVELDDEPAVVTGGETGGERCPSPLLARGSQRGLLLPWWRMAWSGGTRNTSRCRSGKAASLLAENMF